MRKIELFKTAKGWMANFVNDIEIHDMFGTTTIPTAFTAMADAETVRASVAELNPECTVVLRS